MAASKVAAPSLSEYQCLLCTEILIKPVTFPCAHTVCYPCFDKLCQETHVLCPFCCCWISSCGELYGFTKPFFNLELWAKVQEHFPEECRLRVSGQETKLVFESDPSVHVLSAPGELRKEYEEEKNKMEAELKAQKQEEKASAEYIKLLLAEEEEEENRLAEKRQREMEAEREREEEERKRSTNNPVRTKAAGKRKKKQKHTEAIPAQPGSGSTLHLGLQEVRNVLSENAAGPSLAPASLASQIQGAKSTVKSPILSSSACDVEQGLEGNAPKPSTSKAGAYVLAKKAQAAAATAAGGPSARKRLRKSFSEPEEAKISVIEKTEQLEQLYLERRKQEEQDRLFAMQLQRELNKEMIQTQQSASQKENISHDIRTTSSNPEMENEEDDDDDFQELLKGSL